MLALFVKILMI